MFEKSLPFPSRKTARSWTLIISPPTFDGIRPKWPWKNDYLKYWDDRWDARIIFFLILIFVLNASISGVLSLARSQRQMLTVCRIRPHICDKKSTTEDATMAYIVYILYACPVRSPETVNRFITRFIESEMLLVDLCRVISTCTWFIFSFCHKHASTVWKH